MPNTAHPDVREQFAPTGRSFRRAEWVFGGVTVTAAVSLIVASALKNFDVALACSVLLLIGSLLAPSHGRIVCPSCNSKLDSRPGAFCPKCGSENGEHAKRWWCFARCQNCKNNFWMRIVQRRVHYCARCGAHLDDKGI